MDRLSSLLTENGYENGCRLFHSGNRSHAGEGTDSNSPAEGGSEVSTQFIRLIRSRENGSIPGP